MQVAIDNTPSPDLNPTSSAQVTDAEISGGGKNLGDRTNTTPEHYQELGTDPSTKQFRPGEADTGVLVENELGVRLTGRRIPKAQIGSDRTARPMMRSAPVPQQYFDQQWKNIQDQIVKHTEKADLVPINVSGPAPEQVARIRQFIEPLGERVFLVGE